MENFAEGSTEDDKCRIRRRTVLKLGTQREHGIWRVKGYRRMGNDGGRHALKEQS